MPQYDAWVRRSIDIVLAAAGLALTSPLLPAAALAVRLSSPGPILFRGVRVGMDGRHFLLFKFRTMSEIADSGPGVTATDDPRVTTVGRVLRRWKIDELPQLINILRGDMSIVGPRPEDPRFVIEFPAEFAILLSVRPGLTSPATLAAIREEEMFPTGVDIARYYCTAILPKKLALDIDYFQRRTLRSDALVVARTVCGILSPTP